MAFYPNPRSGSNGNNGYAIINGRRVFVGNGMHGGDLAGMAGPGRRGVIMDRDGVRAIDPNRDYQPWELENKKIGSMPDRTKGGPAQGERVLVFLDYANINAGAGPLVRLDYAGLLNYVAGPLPRVLVEAYAYVPIDPRNPEGRRSLVRALQEGGWMVNQKMGKIAGDTYKSNVDMEMCIDIMRSAQHIKPDIIVLCTGDGDFLPVVRELRRMGIRAEVASFNESADESLGYEASGFISLDTWLEETRPEAREAADAFLNEADEGGDPSDDDWNAPSLRNSGREESGTGLPEPPLIR